MNSSPSVVDPAARCGLGQGAQRQTSAGACLTAFPSNELRLVRGRRFKLHFGAEREPRLPANCQRRERSTACALWLCFSRGRHLQDGTHGNWQNPEARLPVHHDPNFGHRREIGADALVYQDIEALKAAVRDLNPAVSQFECSCFDGLYVTGDVTASYLEQMENNRNAYVAPAPDEHDGGDDSGAQLDLNLVSSH